MAGDITPGYNGKILRVNLSKRSITDESLEELFCRRYIGGAGFVAYYLWKELTHETDALGPDNKLVFALGPVSGLQLPGAARLCVGAKSPLTGTIAKSESGGFWMAELKRAGYDAVIVEGQAETPVYLCIQDGETSIKDASHLWGKETKETQEAIRAELNDTHVQTCQIGPGGEKKVLYACIMFGLYDAAGRGGLGAVMGSKNLKAIAVRGHKLPQIHDSEWVKKIRQQIIAMDNPMMKDLSEFGTGGPDMVMYEGSGSLPVRNFRDVIFPEVQQIHSGVMKKTMQYHMDGCYACPVRCKKAVQFDEPYHVDTAYGGPEYEAIGSLGSNCGVGNVKAICKANERCNALSLDVISTGVVIGFAMECFERGLLNTRDTGGIDLRFGNGDAVLEVIELIARRKDIGNRMAEGTAHFAREIGKDAEEFAVHVKGLEPAMHDPRAHHLPGLSIGYTINPHGGDHVASLGGGTSPMGMEQFHPLGILHYAPGDDLGPYRLSIYKLTHCLGMMKDCLATCAFLPYSFETHVEILKAVTGWNTGIMELLRVGERVLTVMRLFNLREGLTAKDDILPPRFYQPKIDGDRYVEAINQEEMDKAKGYYYTFMGWNAKGVPLPEKIAELEIV